ncbi:MAG: folylpolyglutamate synthase/dihydrofolate synthase family protein [Nitrospirota bacterium]
MKYSSAIKYLYGLQKFGMKFGLDNIRTLLAALGNPHESFRSIHVAGTNGKGSTSAMIETILRTSGAATGLFTSPHLVSFTERIRINGQEIEENDVIELADEVRSAAEKIKDLFPTFFEVVTAMAFIHFRKTKTDWAVIEAGMGGRLDATNIITPEVSVITRIDFDHREFLGRTLKEIAAEKAGIIKDGVPVIVSGQAHEAMDVIESRAFEKKSPLYKSGRDFSSELLSDDPEETRFNYRGTGRHEGIKLSLSGEHQIFNAAIAARTIEEISARYPRLVFDIKSGLENTRWPGRLEKIKDEPPILIDGAHNPSAAEILSRHLKKLLAFKYRRIIMVIGIMNDKDIDGILKPLLPLASEIIFTSPAYGRAATPDMLAARAVSEGYSSRRASGVSDALNMAEGICLPGDLILVTGSFYTIGEAKEAAGQKGILARLRE